MSRILVVAYSRSGNTRSVARAIAAQCHADFEEIHDVRSRQGLPGYIRSAWEALQAKASAILPPRRDPAGYDLVVLGSPTWASHLSSPMRRYLLDHGASLRQTAHFVTEGGSGGETALADMAGLTRRPPSATLVLTDAQIAGSVQTGIAGFCGQIERSAAVAAVAA